MATAIYSPALNGQFVLDDLALPFHLPLRDAPLLLWLSRFRPVLMLSYWVNYKLWGVEPFAYHFTNLLIHVLNSALVYLVISKILAFAGWPVRRRTIASLSGALLFLLHPIQTESVSYVAGRSESLAALFLLLSYVCFLYRRTGPINWSAALLTLGALALGGATKESAVCFAAVFLFTDSFWEAPSPRAGPGSNWRLYALMVPGTIAGVVAVLAMLTHTPTAGFSVVTARWYQYAFTETRAIWTYVRLAVIPFGQSLDHDFPVSRTILEHGALFYAALLVATVGVLVWKRKKYPVSCFGFLLFLLLLAPTSSVVPIDDPLAERRMYLALLGLILVACDLASRLRLSPTAGYCVLAGLALFFGDLCYARNQLWGKPDTLLALAAAQSSTNPRPMLNLTEVLIRHNRCDLAIPYLRRAERVLGRNYYVEVGWGRTLACLNHDVEALPWLLDAARLKPCSDVFEWIGLLYGKLGRLGEAGSALKKAVQLNPYSPSAHGSLALWYSSVNDLASAEREYRTATKLDSEDLSARFGLSQILQREAAVSDR